MTKTVEVGSKSITLATITNKIAKQFPLDGEDGKPLTNGEFNLRLVANSLVAGGATLEEAQDIIDDFPYFKGLDNQFGTALDAAIEVNGLKVEKDAGKESPEPTAEQASA